MSDTAKIRLLAAQARRDVIRMVSRAGSGHPGGSLSSADFLAVLFADVMRHDPKTWRRDGRNADMFFLSIGHIAPLYYSLLARCGYFPVDELKTLRQLGSRLQGHPCTDHGLPGISVATGSLGQGLSVACGAALAKKLLNDPHRVYVLLGDGESEEGQIWEAALFAAHHKIDNLIAMTDWNHRQIDGPIEEVGGMEKLKEKWESFGWLVLETDGHDIEAIETAFEQARACGGRGKPVMLLMHTHMGQGVDFMLDKHEWHGKAPNAEETRLALQQLPETSLRDF